MEGLTTPKEKAEYLMERYYNFVSGWTTINKPWEKPSARYEGKAMRIGRAIQCSLIAVDEIIDQQYTVNDLILDTHGKTLDESAEIVKYWGLVKDELCALDKNFSSRTEI